jgi:mannose-6-phosphate isomerase-like protein (cupin superfamily)
MGLRFIFMLTQNDKTVEDAEIHLKTALAAGIHHIGFKDVGLPVARLKKLNKAIKDGGATSYLEVVSLDQKSELNSARAAVDIGVDILLGGTNVEDVLPILADTDIQYFPFPGKIVGHPSVLEGSIDDIAENAREVASFGGVHGLDLLAYRSSEDVKALMAAVCSVTDKPVIMAGSIDNRDRIQAIRDAGGAGFTIGTAAIIGEYVQEADEPGEFVPENQVNLGVQLKGIMKDVAHTNHHVSPYSKKNLDKSFGGIQKSSTSCVSYTLNNMQIKLSKIDREADWYYRETEDEMFFVHKGKLMMQFRDREEIVEEGEFIVVPHGVEHCPAPLTEMCEVMLLSPQGV